VVLADATIGLDYILGKLEWILDGLVLYPERMMANLESTRGLIYSSRVLLALVDTGMLREDAYAIVQGAAMKVWDDIQQAVPGPGFRDYLESSASAHGEFPLDFAQLEECFDPRSFLTRTGVLFERVEGLEF
jgi:adenylosuccinate lyase